MSPKTSEEELNQLKLTLPQEVWFGSLPIYLYQGFWMPNIEQTIALQNHFQAQDTDIFITSIRKAGTTWLKALIFSLCNRASHLASDSPLLNHNPHDLIPQLESNIYAKSRCPDLSSLESPRMFGTHLPFTLLPDSMKDCNCKIIYICRNPLDTFISSWMFYLNIFYKNKDVESDMIVHYFEKFCEGKFPFGPFEDHVLGYWKKSLEQPEKVCFVKYEDLKADPHRQLKRLAEFLGCPFSAEEVSSKVADGIIELCSFQRLKQIDANNRINAVFPQIHNQLFFRKGEVGDWVNHLTPAVAHKLQKIMEEKFAGSGLTFK